MKESLKLHIIYFLEKIFVSLSFVHHLKSRLKPALFSQYTPHFFFFAFHHSFILFKFRFHNAKLFPSCNVFHQACFGACFFNCEVNQQKPK